MDAAVLAFIGSICTLIITLIAAYYNRQTTLEVEKVKASLSVLNNKSFFKFSKLHEIQLEILKILSKDFYTVEWELKEKFQKEQCQDLINAVSNLKSNFMQNAVFLNKPLRESYFNFLGKINEHIEFRKEHYDAINFNQQAENLDEFRLLGKYQHIIGSEIFDTLKKELDDEVERFLIDH